MLKDIIDNLKLKQEEMVENFSKEIKSLRTGRANSAMVENILIEAYGTRTLLKSLAQVSVPEPRIIIIEPYDKGVVKEVVKGIVMSGSDLNPSIDGNLIRIKLPDLNEESRKNLVKVLKNHQEKARIAVRLARDEAKKEIEKLRSSSQITKDDYFKTIQQFDTNTSQINARLDEITKSKEEEIMTV